MGRLTPKLGAVMGAILLLATTAATVAAADPIASSVSGGTQGRLQDNHPVTLEAVVTTTSDAFAAGATMTFEDVADVVPDCVAAVDPGNETTCTIADLAPGAYQFTVTYSGNADVAGSESAFDFVIAADTLDASGVGRNYPTFYPRTDGYRDTLTISGNRAEAISVAIDIYNSNNVRIRWATRSSFTGPYSFVWTGRNGSGTILPAGRYRIVQTLTDGHVTQAFTSYVTLSRKILVTKTKYVTKNGSAGAASLGSVLVSPSTHAARLRATASSDAGVGYQFTIPNATVYKSIKFQVYAKGLRRNPPNLLAMQNFNQCAKSPSWNLNCFDRLNELGHSSTALHWSSTSGNVTRNRSGQTVRGLAYVQTGTVTIYKVRVKVVYQVLE